MCVRVARGIVGAKFAVGLCTDCVHARRVRSSRGSIFFLCELSARDPNFAKYPRLPILRCSGYLEKAATAGGQSKEGSIEADNGSKVPRRQFNKSVIVGGLLVAGAGLVIFLRARSSGNFPPRVISRVGDIAVGGSKIFTYPTEVEPCILLRPAQDTYIAFSRLCTHASCPLFYNAPGNRLECPCHGGAFSITDGSVLQGPPPRPLPQIVLERRGNDLVATGFAKS
jgi:Rieske Fe-S protein